MKKLQPIQSERQGMVTPKKPKKAAIALGRMNGLKGPSWRCLWVFRSLKIQ